MTIYYYSQNTNAGKGVGGTTTSKHLTLGGPLILVLQDRASMVSEQHFVNAFLISRTDSLQI